MAADLSAFQKEKLEHLFHTFYDTNKNGYITHSDFADLVKRLRKWGPNDMRLRNCERVMNRAWISLKRGADQDKDQKVDRQAGGGDAAGAQVDVDEWITYWGGMIQKIDESCPTWAPDIAWLEEYMNFWFDLMDTSGDGYVDEDEYTEVCMKFGVSEKESRACFKKFGTRPVDRDYFGDLWLQFITANYRAAAGNYVFGHIGWKNT